MMRNETWCTVVLITTNIGICWVVGTKLSEIIRVIWDFELRFLASFMDVSSAKRGCKFNGAFFPQCNLDIHGVHDVWLVSPKRCSTNLPALISKGGPTPSLVGFIYTLSVLISNFFTFQSIPEFFKLYLQLIKIFCNDCDMI